MTARAFAALVTAASAIGCAGSPSPPARPAPSTDAWIAKHGAGLQAAIEAAEHADQAYATIADTPIEALRDDGGLRAQVAAMVGRARNAFRKAKSYDVKFCDEETRLESIGGAVLIKAQMGRDEKAVELSPAGKALKLVAVHPKPYESLPSYHVFLVSSRGKVIMEGPVCGNGWGRYRPLTITNDPHAAQYKYGPDVADDFAKILLGDGIEIDSIIVDIKR